MRMYLLAAPLIAAQTVLAQSVVLDDFDSAPNDELGGPREVSSSINANPYAQPSSFDVVSGFSFEDITGAAIFNSGIGVEQTGVIQWDNNDAGLDLDAAALGINGFELDFLQIDQAFEINIQLNAFDVFGSGAFLSRVIGPATESTTYGFAAGDFFIVENFDFTTIDAITITFNTVDNPTASLDFILTEFRATVPAPASVGLLGLAGLVTTRRRR